MKFPLFDDQWWFFEHAGICEIDVSQKHYLASGQWFGIKISPFTKFCPSYVRQRCDPTF
jgi:hypothetical protein